jgi:peptidoglycan/LPS O-acetylase OafA/YrhL
MTSWRELGAQTFASLFYVENWRLAVNANTYTAASPTSSPFQHFWSLSVEEQFYLVWPILFLIPALFARLGRRNHSGRRAVLAVIVVVAILSFAWSVWFTDFNRAAAYFVTPTRIWELAAGAVLAFVPVGPRLGPVATGIVRWAGLAAIATTALLFTDDTPFPGAWALLPVVGAAMFIAAGSAGSRLGDASPLAWRPVAVTGDLSYSLYLWHWPLIVLLSATVDRPLLPLEKIGVLGLSVGLAAVSHAYVENRWRGRNARRRESLRRRESPRRTRAILGVVSGAAVLAVLTSGAALVIVPQRVADGVAAQAGRVVGAADAVRGDYATDTVGGPVPAPVGAIDDNWLADNPGCQQKLGAFAGLTTCEVGAPQERATLRVALVGDSHAGHWEPALSAIADDEGWSLSTYVRSACPITTVPASGSTDHDDACLRWNAAVMSALEREHYDVVIVSAASYTRFPATDGRSEEQSAAAGYAGAWERMEATGAEVIALEDNPDPTRAGIADIDACVAQHEEDLGPCLFRRPPADADPQTDAAAEAGVQVVDTTRWFCNNKVCSPIIGGVLVYQDRTHLTATYAKTIAPYLRQELVPLVEG